MAVRRYVTVGIAVTSAGFLVAAEKMVVPYPTPRDEKVIVSVETKLTAAQFEFVSETQAKWLIQSVQAAAQRPDDFYGALRLAEKVAQAATVPDSGQPDASHAQLQQLGAAQAHLQQPGVSQTQIPDAAQAQLRQPDAPGALLQEPDPTPPPSPTSLIQQLIDDFFIGGVTFVVGDLVVTASSAIFGPDALPTLVGDAYFFGYPFDSSLPVPGLVGVANLLVDALFGNIQSPVDPGPDPEAGQRQTRGLFKGLLQARETTDMPEKTSLGSRLLDLRSRFGGPAASEEADGENRGRFGFPLRNRLRGPTTNQPPVSEEANSENGGRFGFPLRNRLRGPTTNQPPASEEANSDNGGRLGFPMRKPLRGPTTNQPLASEEANSDNSVKKPRVVGSTSRINNSDKKKPSVLTIIGGSDSKIGDKTSSTGDSKIKKFGERIKNKLAGKAGEKKTSSKSPSSTKRNR